MSLLVIDGATVRQILTYEACIPLMREAMIALSAGRTRQTLRQIIDMGDGDQFGVMPGAAEDTFGAKLISVFPRNFDRAMPSHQGVIALFDRESGAPVAVIQAGEVTAIRTAAASAAATDVLARPDAHVLALLGYGEQAERHAEALARVRPLSEVRVWGRSAERAAAFAGRMGARLPLPFRVCATAREAVEGADLICAVSGASEPILEGAWVDEGAHVNLVGSARAGPREADDDLVARARLFADHAESVRRQGGEWLHALASGRVGETHLLGEIGQVMAGDLPGRLSEADVTVYKSLGIVVQDLASGWFLYRQAQARGLGASVAF
ncbi:ornithine cyclodeaminase [Caulobacter ginsengisoli]|uniref:Ornithine cyclodeaminase n=1 Tax=Caulobacter ginsengisoli TaxID=400775 RepID=A0ABU0IM56_9CAUL|nr:ornithine cyclodeaminase family protein [Caulobacter ginsengisoli]MDQ0463105.1 ornithine cyclodeaminase [Caulobacter ginsengisoli]